MKTISKILVVVDSINIEDSSGSKANVALIKNLSYAGFKIKVYHYTRKEILLSGIECVSISEKKWNGMYLISRLQRILSRKLGININPFVERQFGFSFTFFNDTVSIAKAVRNDSFEPDLIITLSKGKSFRPHYSMLSIPELHHKWIAYVHDPYPVHYYPRPYNWIEEGHKIKENFFREVSLKAKYSAFPSLLLKEWMGSYFPNFLKTGVVIPHQNSKYEVKNNDFPLYFDTSKFNLLHAGNLMAQRSPEGLIEGFKSFMAKNPEARKESQLLLLGSAQDHDKMLEAYRKDSPEIYIYSGSIAFDETYHLQKNVSVNIILEAKSEISPFLPGKFPHCIEANKTILLLAPYNSETRRLLGDDYAFWSEIDAVEKIAMIIEKLYQLWKQNPDNLLLNRSDLESYLSVDYLKKVINGLKIN